MLVQENEKSLVRIEDVLATGPVERGLYVAEGPRDLTYRVFDGLAELIRRQSLLHSPLSSFEGQASTLRSLGVGGHRRQSHIGQILWIDSGNVFDPYYLSAVARQKGVNPSRALRAVRVGRPFTAFQYHQMLANVPNAALVAPLHPPINPADFGGRAPALRSLGEGGAFWWTPLVVISDLIGLFYDPELPEDDMRRAFYQFLLRLSFLKEKAIVLAVLQEEQAPKGREDLLPRLLEMIRPQEVRVRQWMLEPAA